jgi:methionyl-tRNA formyltransferase
MQPWPVASTTWDRGQGAPVRLIVHETRVDAGQGGPGQVVEATGDRLVVAAGEGAVRLLRVQLEGKKAMDAAEFLRGYRAEGTWMRP